MLLFSLLVMAISGIFSPIAQSDHGNNWDFSFIAKSGHDNEWDFSPILPKVVMAMSEVVHFLLLT